MGCFDPDIGGSATKDHTSIQVLSPLRRASGWASLRVLPQVATPRQVTWINESTEAFKKANNQIIIIKTQEVE